MPELPEVETMVRSIRAQIVGRAIAQVVKCPTPCRPIALTPGMAAIGKRAVGTSIVEVRRRAKRVVLELSSGDSFVIEPRMTGLMLIADPPDRKHLRIEWKFADDAAPGSLFFWDQRGLGTVSLLSSAQLAERLEGGRLGPDALEMTIAGWQESLKRTARPIKVALLDQKLVAGIGNLYASEILHRSRIDPRSPANQLTCNQISRLVDSTVAILEEAIRYEGSTLNDGTYRNGLNQAGSYQNAHRVYDRTGEPCPSCRRDHVQRIVQAQRSTFFCPRCQK